MKTRAAFAAGWLAGMVLILAGLPAWIAASVPVVVTAGALAWARWGTGAWPGLRAAVKLKHAAKTGGTLERA